MYFYIDSSKYILSSLIKSLVVAYIEVGYYLGITLFSHFPSVSSVSPEIQFSLFPEFLRAVQ